jgi:RAB protein geranylgeranyltransferase component A
MLAISLMFVFTESKHHKSITPSMNIFKSLIRAICIAILATSCNTTSESKTQLAYGGSVNFNRDSTMVVGLSPNGYISYTNNGNTLLIERDNKSKLCYSFNGSDKQSQIDADQRPLLEEAIDGIVSSERDNVTEKR